MNPKPIRNEDDYRAALVQASAWFDNEPEPGSTDGNAFAILLTLIEAYESQHFPIGRPI